MQMAVSSNDTSNPAKYPTAAPPRCLWPIHRTTLYHPERSSHRITGERPQSPHLFQRYLDDGSAQTAEPPVEHRSVHGVEYWIGRPLFFVTERTTAAVAASLGVQIETSGCGHSLSSST